MKQLILFFLLLPLAACSQKQKTAKPSPVQKTAAAQISQGEYIVWQSDLSEPGGSRALTDLTVKGNTYSSPLHGTGTYRFDPATKIVRFKGGGWDQRKKAEEWIGVFYKKGETFLDGSGGTAVNDMLLITKASDWNSGRRGAWLQKCDLK